jgi:hypothetical protein
MGTWHKLPNARFSTAKSRKMPYTTAVSSGVGHAQAIALTRAAVEQLKASLKAKMLAPPMAMPPKKNSYHCEQGSFGGTRSDRRC